MNKEMIRKELKRIITNEEVREKELASINMFKDLYDIICKYQEVNMSYEEVMSSNNTRLDFLINSVDIALKKKNMDTNTAELILSMYDNIYSYLFEQSKLEELTIPNEMKDNLKDNMSLPNSSQLLYAITLVQTNKKIFNKYFADKDLSQTIREGLHTNITEVLRIRKENVSHLIGLTNDDSIYCFYKKKRLAEIVKELKEDYPETFEEKFKEIFGLDYNEENETKIITIKKYEENSITEEQKLLNKTFEIFPKEQTLDFYLDEQNTNELIQENKKVNDFVYEYIKSDVVNQSKNKGKLNILKNLFKNEEEELRELLDKDSESNQDKIRKIINKYIRKKKINLAEDKEFQEKFEKTFKYKYPLIQYNELITKNISFYNFSLFNNLNKIIVNYKNDKKKTKSDVYLVSYAKKKFKDLQDKFKQKIEARKAEYTAIIFNKEENNRNLNEEYINQLKSLFMFPPDTRYYLRFGFSTEKEKKEETKDKKTDYETKEKNNILDQIEKIENITLIGFATNNQEEERIKSIENADFTPLKHIHYCETNITANFQDYEKDYIKNGIEYNVDMITSESAPSSPTGNMYDTSGGPNGSGGGTPNIPPIQIVKIAKPKEVINNYLEELNNYNAKKNMDFNEKIQYELYLLECIKKTHSYYLRMKKSRIEYLNYKLYKENLDIKEIKEIKKNLNNENNALYRLLAYNNELNNYIDNYKETIIKNANETEEEKEKRRGR